MTSGKTKVSSLPREIAPGVFWLSACLKVPVNGRLMHSHNNCYLIAGSRATVLIDNAIADGWDQLAADIEKVLGARPLDYLMPTHPELPHMGNTWPLLDKYPACRLVGDLRNYHLYFPDAVDRMEPMRAGDVLDLGGREVEMVEAVIHDIPNTLWAYDRQERIMFVGDAFPYTHEHEAEQCGLTAEELDNPPDAASAGWAISRALNWIRYVHPAPVIAELDRHMGRYAPRMIGPSHGGVITDPDALASFFAAGLWQAWEEANGMV